MADQAEAQFVGTLAGTITHYFDKLGVAVVHPDVALKIGDALKIYDKSGSVIVEQSIESMEIDRNSVQSVTAGQDFGMRVAGPVKEGYLVYKQ